MMQKEMEHDTVADMYANQVDCKLQTGMLNELLRKQLAPSTNVVKTSETRLQSSEMDLSSATTNTVDYILDNATVNRTLLHEKLSELYFQQKRVYDALDIDPALLSRQFISHSGLILSPDHCVTTQLDDMRVHAFIRGIDKAIKSQLENQSSISIVYPACGPFAPLLLPLIAHYQSQNLYCSSQLRITLIDIQPGAIASLQALIREWRIGDYIENIACIDATLYPLRDNQFDLLVLEAMQHGFSREGHFLLARHFCRSLTDTGEMLPQKVTISAQLNCAQSEFVEQWREAECVSYHNTQADILVQRVVLGDILELTKHSVLSLGERVLDKHTRLIECGQVSIPHIDEHQGEQTLLLCTQVNVYENEKIYEYDSGITHPLPEQQVCINFTPREPRDGDLLVKTGDDIKFYYRLNGLPGFLATWSESAAQGRDS